MKPIRTVALFGKNGSAEVVEALVSLLDQLNGHGLTVLVENEIAAELGMVAAAADIETIRRSADVAIVLGGDGTLLGAARSLAEYDVPLVGINQGRLGFMTDIARADMHAAIDRLLAGEFTEDRRMLLEASILRRGEVVSRTLALNDVVMNKGSLGSMIEIRVRVDDEFLYVLRADGLIVATPTGSTAYALSANGPILQPDVPGISLVPLCPHALSYRPITISDRSRVDLMLVPPHDCTVHFDGQNHFDIVSGDTVRLERSSHVVTLLHPPGYSYFAMLRQKLHWSSTPHR